MEKLENEVWRDIPGFEGLYQVSDMGRVKSLGRKVLKKNGFYENKPERLLKPFSNGKGYWSVELYTKDSKSKRLYIHRLVMLAFEGYKDLVVDHEDRDRSNNKLKNLRYVTARKNTERGTNEKSASKYIGVSINRRNTFKKWKTSIRILGKRYFIGSFEEEEDAAEAYQKALKNWQELSMTPKGEILKKENTKIFKPKSAGIKGKNAKKVLDTESGIFYDSAKEAATIYDIDYKYLSSMLSGARPNKTSLIYAV